jgi:hypothetical protein
MVTPNFIIGFSATARHRTLIKYTNVTKQLCNKTCKEINVWLHVGWLLNIGCVPIVNEQSDKHARRSK